VSFLDASNGNVLLGTATLAAGASALNFVTASNPPDGNGAAAVAVGGFNGDGILDFAVANFTANTISVFLGDGPGNFTQTASLCTVTLPGLRAWGRRIKDGLDLRSRQKPEHGSVTALCRVRERDQVKEPRRRLVRQWITGCA
jgi:hypothetical protein